MGVAPTSAMYTTSETISVEFNTTEKLRSPRLSLETALYNHTIIIISITCILAPLFLACLCWLQSRSRLCRTSQRSTGDNLSVSAEYQHQRFAPPDYEAAVSGSSASSTVAFSTSSASEEENPYVSRASSYANSGFNDEDLGVLPSYSDVVERRYSGTFVPRTDDYGFRSGPAMSGSIVTQPRSSSRSTRSSSFKVTSSSSAGSVSGSLSTPWRQFNAAPQLPNSLARPHRGNTRRTSRSFNCPSTLMEVSGSYLTPSTLNEIGGPSLTPSMCNSRDTSELLTPSRLNCGDASRSLTSPCLIVGAMPNSLQVPSRLNSRPVTGSSGSRLQRTTSAGRMAGWLTPPPPPSSFAAPPSYGEATTGSSVLS